MNQRIKKLWVKALRSGEYKQGTSALKRGDRFCCLGVLCDLRAKATGKQWRTIDGESFYASQRLVLPPVVRRWAGLADGDPLIEMPADEIRLTDMNDAREYSFKKIANAIEKYL